MITITCDVCKEEDSTLDEGKMQKYNGTFSSAEGFIVSVSFSCPPGVHICKSCLIDVLRDSKPYKDMGKLHV